MESLYILLSIIVIICLAYISFQTYIRPRFPVKVTCWFCGEKTSVPYGNKNCWDCLSCDQYNGFTEDGDYNKPIPSQYDDRLNHPVSCEEDEFISGNDIFCGKCSQNQLLKTKQLANFVPYHEKNYNMEVEAFERHLEKVYKLCLSCDMRVKQELQVQNDAISSRLSHLDESLWSRGLTHTGANNMPIQDGARIIEDRRTLAGRVLHAVSLSCSLAILISQVTPNGDSWPLHPYLIGLRPLLELLDKHATVFAIAGLFTGLAAKLALGKYRLYIIDAVSCPLWLMVLLLQTGFLHLNEAGPIADFLHLNEAGPMTGFLHLGETGSMCMVISCVVNTITCGLCLGVARQPRNIANVSMTRLSLDLTDSGIAESISPFSSISQQCIPNQPSESAEVPRHAPEIPTSRSALLGGCTTNRHSYLDDTVAELDSISLGLPGSRPDTGSSQHLFSTSPRSSSMPGNISGCQSIPQALRQWRPLITPATFNHASNSSNSQRPAHLRHGLFSLAADASTNCLERPSTPLLSTSFCSPSPSLFSLDRHSFTPERPSSPVTTAFGATPFSGVPSVSGRSTPVGHTFGGGTFSRNSTFNGSSYATPGAFVKPQIRRRSGVRGDDNDDKSSIFTSFTQSSQCAVDSTTSIQEKKGSFWRHPGFIGFILGGSVVANILLAVHMVWGGQNYPGQTGNTQAL